MAPRPPVRRERNNDYSAVGTAGRRTGVTLPQGKLDENGLEEITGLFSSPTKPSPVKQQYAVANEDENDVQNSTFGASEDMTGMDSSGLTPTQTLSARRSLGAPALPPPPRSASPRKTGISGTARRSNGIDILSPSKDDQVVNAEDRENSPTPTPIRMKPRRFVPSPEKKEPLKEVVSNGTAVTSKHTRDAEEAGDRGVAGGSDVEQNEGGIGRDQPAGKGRLPSEPPSNHRGIDIPQDEDSVQNPMGDDEMEEFLSGIDNIIQNAAPVPESAPPSTTKETEKVVDSIEPAQQKLLLQKPTSQRYNGRKRKSEEFEEPPAAVSTKKPAKKLHAPTADVSKPKPATKQKAAPVPVFSQDFAPQPSASPIAQAAPQSQPHPASAAARLSSLTTKDPNTHLSVRQQAELNQIIEKVRARPGKLKTLYVLKREKSKKSTTSDDVRSGRAVVKPLAYWNAEQCVHDDGSGAPGLELGARIPLSCSVKEIKAEKPSRTDEDEGSHDEDDDYDGYGYGYDGHEDPWETEIGVFRGQTAVYSNQPSSSDQTHPEETEETVLAFHPSSMLTREVKGSGGFKFAKLVSTPFFGSGIVDLPPGAVKRPKYSRGMHMCFFVARGRVTVRVGREIEEDGDGERFSVGRGGVFQVPRGNKYSIENLLGKPARIFFSQGCETVPEVEAS